MKKRKVFIDMLMLFILIFTLTSSVSAFDEWTFPTPYVAGDVVVYNGLYYEVLQPHTSQSYWLPNQAVSLYKQITIDECVKPSFCINTFYERGEYVLYNDNYYYVTITHTSQSDWTPDVAVSLFSKVLSYEDGKPVLSFGDVTISYEQNFEPLPSDIINGFEINKHSSNNYNIKMDSENYPDLNKPVKVEIKNHNFNNVIKPRLYKITYENVTIYEPVFIQELNENGTYTDKIISYNAVIKEQRIKTEVNTEINVNETEVNFELTGFSEYDLTDGLVAYWTMDDDFTNGTTMIDSLLRYNGSISGATTGQTGKINEAYSFDGSNDYISHYLDGNVGSENFTITMWIKPSTITGTKFLMERRDSSNLYVGWIIVQTGSNVFIQLDTGTPQPYITHTTNMIANNWYFLSMKREGETLSININDGTPQTITGATGDISSNAINIIGANQVHTANWYSGLIDEVAIYNRSLSTSEISALYNDGDGFQYPFEINVSVKQPFQNFTLDKTKTAVTSNDLNFYPYLGSPYFDNVFRFEDYNLFEINFTDPYNNQTKNFNFTYDTETNQFYNDRATDSENGSIVFELVSSSGVNAGKGYMQIYTTNKYEGDILFNYRLTNNYGGNYNDTFKITLKPYFSYINEAMSPELNFSYFGEYLFQLDVLIRLLGLNNLNLGMYAENTSLSITGLNANDSDCWNYYINGTCASSIITSNLTQNLSSLYQSKILYPDDLYNEVFFTDSNLTWNYEKNDYIVTSTDIHVFNFSNPFSMVENTSLYLEFYTEPVSNITSFDLQVYLVSKDVTDLNTFFSGTWRTSNQTQLVDVVTRTETPHHEHTNLSKHYLTALLTNENGEIGSLDLNNSFYMVLTTSNPSEPRGWNLKYLNNTICNNTGEWLFKDGLNNFINPDGCPDVHFHLARRNTDYRDGVNITMTTEFENYNDTNTEIFYFLEFEIFPPNPTSFLNPLDNDTITTRNILVNWESVIHPSNLDFVYELYFNETLINTTTITSYILDTINYENDIPYNLTITIRDSLNQTANTKITITLNRIYGCTNPLAQNYDENAVIDDGSCLAGGLTLEQLDEYYEEKKEEAIYMIAIIVFSIVGLVWAYFVSTLYGGVIVSAMGLLGLFNDFSVTISTILIFLGIMIIMSNKEKLKDGL